MWGLLNKEIFVLKRQIVFVIVMIVSFKLSSRYLSPAVGIFYTIFLVGGSLSYDEKNKWEKLMATMPYSIKTLVLEKYVLGYLFIVGAGIFSGLLDVFRYVLVKEGSFYTSVTEYWFFIGLATLVLSLYLPTMIRFGATQGHIVFLVCLGILIPFGLVFGITFKNTIYSFFASHQGFKFMVGTLFILFLIGVNGLSMLLSIRFYKQRHRQPISII